MAGISDTSPDVERRMIEAYRRMPAWRKWKLVADGYAIARQMHAAGHRLRNPTASPADVNRAWVEMTIGPGPWMDQMRFDAMTPPAEQILPTKYVIAALDDLNIPYAVGGSYASSVHGVPRYTQDADITVEPFPGKERLFALRFRPDEYYADEAMIRDAVARRASVNILHLHTGFKVDLFVRKDRAYDRELFTRRVKAPVFGEAEGLFRVVSAEDSVLLKLEWFRLGGETSEKQWTDIRNVLKTQAGRLDDAYLDVWALDLGVKDLLDKVRAEV